MNPIELETINKVISIIEKASEIISLQLGDIEDMGRNFSSIDENEANKNALIIVTKRNSLKLFKDILDFLIYRLKHEKEEFFIFYLPQVRVLIEIYSYLQYLNNEHEEDQLILILTNNLFTLSSSIRGSQEDYSDIQVMYTEQKNTFQYWLNKYQIDIPDQVEKLSQKKMKKQNLLIVPVEQRLKVAEIIKDCPLSTDVWKNLPNSVYEFYRKFSMYVHGNSLITQGGNENLWIISECLIYSSLVIELVNSRITQNSRMDKHKELIFTVKKELPDFINLWMKRRP